MKGIIFLSLKMFKFRKCMVSTLMTNKHTNNKNQTKNPKQKLMLDNMKIHASSRTHREMKGKVKKN